MFEFSLTKNPIASVLRDVKHAIANHKYEQEESDLIIPGDAGFRIGGMFHTTILRHDAISRAVELGDVCLERAVRKFVLDYELNSDRDFYPLYESCDHNLIPDAAINFILDIVFGSVSKVSTWYHGPFKSNWNPGAGALSNWAGASSGPVATELAATDYLESGRQPAVFANLAASKKIICSTATRFTLASGTSGISLYGSTLNSVATPLYNATNEKLLAASRFATAKSGLGAGDKIDIEYEITGAST